MSKVKLETTLNLLKKANACESGMNALIQSLPKNFNEDKPINLLHILESNGISHFFWAWRATIKSEKKIKRLILHDIIASIAFIYNEKHPKSNIINDVLKSLSTGRNLRKAAYAAYAAYIDGYYVAAYVAYVAAYAAYTAIHTTYAVYVADAAAKIKEQNKQINIIKKYLKR